MKKNASEFWANFVLAILLIILLVFVAFCFLGPLILALAIGSGWIWLYAATVPLIWYIGKKIETRGSKVPRQNSPDLYNETSACARYEQTESLEEEMKKPFSIADDPGLIPDDTILHIN